MCFGLRASHPVTAVYFPPRGPTMRPILFRIRKKGSMFLRKREADPEASSLFSRKENRVPTYFCQKRTPLSDLTSSCDPNRISCPCLRGYGGAPRQRILLLQPACSSFQLPRDHHHDQVITQLLQYPLGAVYRSALS